LFKQLKEKNKSEDNKLKNQTKKLITSSNPLNADAKANRVKKSSVKIYECPSTKLKSSYVEKSSRNGSIIVYQCSGVNLIFNHIREYPLVERLCECSIILEKRKREVKAIKDIMKNLERKKHDLKQIKLQTKIDSKYRKEKINKVPKNSKVQRRKMLKELLEQFLDVILFLGAVCFYSPCILVVELCRALMCCLLCTG
jgi:hypothetical protein